MPGQDRSPPAPPRRDGQKLAEAARQQEHLLREQLSKAPQDLEALCALAELQCKGQRPLEAARTLRSALRLTPPSDPKRLLAMARLALRCGDADAAQMALQRACESPILDAAMLREIGFRSWQSGFLGLALNAYGRLIAQGEATDEAWRELAEVLRFVKVTVYDPNFEILLLACLRRGDLDQQDLAGCAISLLKAKPALAPLLAAEHDWQAALLDDSNAATLLRPILADPLLLALLEKTILADLALERSLTALRHGLMARALRPSAPSPLDAQLEPFAVALALQCFMNEFVFAETPAEEILVARAELALEGAAFDGQSRRLLSALACYRPLYKLEALDRLLPDGGRAAPPALRRLLQVQVVEPRLEENLRNDIAVLTPITDPTSRSVRAFYEETPYPRWSSVKKIEAVEAARVLRHLFPGKVALFEDFPKAPEVLVAGCGTGRHPILAAQLYAHAQVLAIDLSLASLAYATRKAREAAIANLRFAHADLLNLDESAGAFDIIESSGVLVCVEDPFAGLQNLAKRLRPGGAMKIALYSEAARQHVVRARAFIAEKGFDSTPQGIRACREAIKVSNDPLLQDIASGRDFFSTSMVRDLIFHIKEHRFTLPWIGKAAKDLGLTLLGFEISDPIVRQRYRALRPEDRDVADIAALAELEAANPESFAEMYQFWLHRPKAS